MPFKHNLPYKHKYEPLKYKVTNWKDYNKSLKNRGDLTVWFDDNATKKWYYNCRRKPGGKIIYSNVAIEVAATLHLIFNLPLRQTEGFMKSLVKLMKIKLFIPDYSTVSRRMKSLRTKLRSHNYKSGTHIILDGSGLSVYGADEFYKIKKRIS